SNSGLPVRPCERCTAWSRGSGRGEWRSMSTPLDTSSARTPCSRCRMSCQVRLTHQQAVGHAIAAFLPGMQLRIIELVEVMYGAHVARDHAPLHQRGQCIGADGILGVTKIEGVH